MGINRDRGQVVVEAGSVRLTLSPSELEPMEGGAAARKASQPGGAGGGVTLTGGPEEGPSGEINLVGLRVEEALARLDRYLDDCLLAGMLSVRIIHGRGTGALRAAVARMLKDHMGVESHAHEDPRAGGDAVTVAVLRR